MTDRAIELEAYDAIISLCLRTAEDMRGSDRQREKALETLNTLEPLLYKLTRPNGMSREKRIAYFDELQKDYPILRPIPFGD